MKAAIELLYEKGFTAITFADISKRAGVSRGALTHYFSTKEALLLAAAQYALEEEMHKIDVAALGELSPVAAMEAYFDASANFFLSKNFLAQAGLSFALRYQPRVAEEYYPLTQKYREAFDSAWREVLIRAGMEEATAMELIDMTNISFRGLALHAARVPLGGSEASLREKLSFVRKKLQLLFLPVS